MEYAEAAEDLAEEQKRAAKKMNSLTHGKGKGKHKRR